MIGGMISSKKENTNSKEKFSIRQLIAKLQDLQEEGFKELNQQEIIDYLILEKDFRNQK